MIMSEERYVKVIKGKLAGNVYRLILMSDSGDIFGVKVLYEEPMIYVNKEDVEFVSKEIFETKNESVLNNTKFEAW